MRMNLLRHMSIHKTLPLAALTLALVETVSSPKAIAADQIIEVRQGSVTIQQENQSSKKAGVGTTLSIGDSIHPTPGAVVTIQCSNNVTREVRRDSGLGSICPDSVTTRFNTRGRGGCDFLAFLNHRCIYATQVLDHPLLRWSSIPGVNRYRVKVTTGNQTLWEQTVEGAEVCYTGTALQPGVTYQFLVTPENPAIESAFHLSLQRLAQAQTEVVQAAIAQINAQNLSTDAKAIALANIYQETGQTNGSGLVLDAIATLEPLVSAGNQISYVHRLLGDLYLQVGLLEAAIPRYQKAIDLAQTADDPHNQALAQVGLANIAAAKGDRTAAGQWLRQARKEYARLGNTKQVELVDQWLHKLENPLLD